MKLIKFLIPVAALLLVSSCVSVSVVADYDKQANFTEYKSFAFYKPGIDKAEISDLDKKRILRAIEAEMTNKGFVKSDSPDLLVSIFTKEKERVDVYNNYYGMGWYWNPWWWGPNYGNSVTTRTEGSLYIDLIDANKKELVWQGKGSGYLTKNVAKKDERIYEFVSEILKKYPPMAGGQ